MRTLILTCSTGGGHNSCARAIQQVFYQNRAVCEIADSLQFFSNKFSHFMSWGHTTMYRHIPGLFRWGYGFAEKHPAAMQENGAAYKLLAAGAENLYAHLRAGDYDTVICTHVFSGLLLENTQKKYRTKWTSAFVATDYTCSPGTATCAYDRCFIPHESLSHEFVAQGIPNDKIIPSGIPVGQPFYSTLLGKPQAKAAVGVDPAHSHLLMMCGSMGCGPMEELTKVLKTKLSPSMELSIVCGTNEKLRQALEAEAEGNPRIHIYGFVDYMDALMDSADLYLTKPGGLSTTEAAVKRLPMVFVDAVAGCEAHNLHFFVDRGGAVTADTSAALGKLCIALLNDPARRASMAENLSRIAEKPAAEVIYKVMQTV